LASSSSCVDVVGAGIFIFFIPKIFRCWRLSLPAAPKGKEEEDPKAVRERWP
jgi:hypothetical protein